MIIPTMTEAEIVAELDKDYRTDCLFRISENLIITHTMFYVLFSKFFKKYYHFLSTTYHFLISFALYTTLYCVYIKLNYQ